MIKNRHVCFTLSICFILFMPVIAMSEENKKDLKNTGSDRVQIKKNLKKMPGLVFSWIDEKYSMRTIRPNPNIDPEIVKNNFNPNIDYKLRIINPYKRKEITRYKGPCFGGLKQKFQLLGKRYETPISSSAK